MTRHKLHVLHEDLSSDDYHGCKESYSSSQLKEILKSEESFHEKYVLRTGTKEHRDAFDTGNYYHTAILEPHLLKKQFVVFSGQKRFGSKWEAFKEANKNKTIITAKQLREAENLISGTKKCPVAMGRLKQGKSEISLFVEILVHAGEIYAPAYKKRLTRDGWVKEEGKVPTKGSVRMVLKVRADRLAERFVLDLKSMNGNPKIPDDIQGIISNFVYDLSAAMYLDLFSLELPSIQDFIWVFASKDQGTSKSWRASKLNVMVGRVKWSSAVKKIASNTLEGWAFEPSLGEIDPAYWELHHLKEKDTDLF